MKVWLCSAMMLGIMGCHTSPLQVRSEEILAQEHTQERGLAVWVAHPESLGQALVMLDGDKALTLRALFLTEDAVTAVAPTSEWYPALVSLTERGVRLYACEQALQTFGLTAVADELALQVMPDLEQSEAHFRRSGWFFVSFP